MLSGKTKRHLVAALSAWALLPALKASAVTADGFITQVSGNVVQVGATLAQWNDQTRCSRYDDAYAAWEYDLRVHHTSMPCVELALKVGAYVHIVGTTMHDEIVMASKLGVSDPWAVYETSQLLKKPLRLPRLRIVSSLSGGPLNGMLSGGAFLEEAPTLVQPTGGIVAHLWINGFPLDEYSDTDVRLVPREIDRKSILRYGENDLGNSIRLGRQPKGSRLAPPADDKLLPGIYLAYRAAQGDEGRPGATALTIFPDSAVMSKMAALHSTPQITEPSYTARLAGTIRYGYGDAIQIVPDRDIQEYVRRVGMEVVPAFQRDLVQSDSSKVKFRFYVVHPFNNLRENGFIQMDGAKTLVANWRASNWKGLDSPFVIPADNSRVDRIVEMPDGVILIPDVALSRFHNKAQLAFALSVAVQSIVQRQEYIAVGAMQYGSGEYAVPPSEISDIETMQALRLSIRQMYLAGYDIREAPFAWKYERGEQVSNPVINSPHPDNEFPWYAAYAFHYLSQYYCDVDYSKLQRGEPEYAQFLDELRKADPEAFESVDTAPGGATKGAAK